VSPCFSFFLFFPFFAPFFLSPSHLAWLFFLSFFFFPSPCLLVSFVFYCMDHATSIDMIRIDLPRADVCLLPDMVPIDLGKRLFRDLSILFAAESRKKVTVASAPYTLSRKTLVLVDAEQLDALALVVPAIWGKDVTIAPLTGDALELRRAIEARTGKTFNICLANYYNTGNDVIHWHSDHEERGSTSCIASVSLGAPRPFQFRAIPTSPEMAKSQPILASPVLEHGSLLIMGEGCQEHYQHALPRDKTCHAPRLNLTFRLFDASRYQPSNAFPTHA
jgi:hypothetical protein